METHSLESKLQILCREAMALGCSRVRIVGTDLLVVREAARAFYMGFPLAMGFGAGECSLCLPSRPCSALRGEPCAHSLKARPAMEACGFDVFAIVEKVGWPMVPIGHRSRKEDVPCASLVGLVLIT